MKPTGSRAVAAAIAIVVSACLFESGGPAARQIPSATAPERIRVMGQLPHFRLASQDGAPFGSNELDGKVWIATFVFTRCAQTCPLQMSALAKLQADLSGPSERADVRFVAFTVDPEHDTPPVLQEYARRYGAEPDRFTMLTGDRDALWSLCKDHFKLPVSSPGDTPGAVIAHSQNLVLVDRARRIRGYYDALDDQARTRLVHDLRIVLGDPPGPITKSKEVDRGILDGRRAYVPGEVRDTPWMKDRAEAQARTVGLFHVRHDFKLTDRLPQSGITFKNKVVDDAGRFYKGVHYDHGNGLAVADVDGDGLYDLYFVNQLGGNMLFRNLGGGKFEDITARAGVGVGDRVGVTASFADIDNDGDPDLYVTSVRKGNLLFENDGKGRFKDITKSSGLDHQGHSSAAVFFDYDKDGLLDLFLANVGKYTTDEIGAGGYYVGFADAFSGQLKPERSEQSILYHNLGGGKFADVSKQVDLVHVGWTGAASPVDVNEDGWPDLYVLNMQGHDEYYENEKGQRFVRKSREVFPRTPWGSMGIKSFDFDNDGHMDIYVTDMHTDMADDAQSALRYWYAEKIKITDMYNQRFLNTDGNHVLGNAFFRNEGGGKFREISDDIGAETYWPWGFSTGDLNADGFEDVFVTASMNYPYRYQVNSVLLNDLGREFLDSEFLVGAEPRRDGRTSTYWFTLDCDGADKAHFGCQGRSGTYEVWGALGSRSSAIFDLDNDGDLDIVTNDFNSEPMVLTSDLIQRDPGIKYLEVKLTGTKSNRSGLGARVTVKAGGKSYTKVLDGQSGYLSQSLYPLYFGLGEAARVDQVEVAWPSGRTQVVGGPIEPNRILTITEK
jgi:enediyne biosynthesis protein E4